MDRDYSKLKLFWPRSFHRGLDISLVFKASCPARLQRSISSLNLQTFQTVFFFSDLHKFSLETRLIALNILAAVGQRKVGVFGPQQAYPIALMCLLIASKVNEKDSLTYELIHRYTNHTFSSPQLSSFEAEVYLLLNFNILENKHFPISSNLKELLFLTRPLFTSSKFSFLLSTSELILQISLTKMEHLFDCFEENPTLFYISVIVAALILLSQAIGRFPALLRLQNATGLMEESAIELAKKILKNILGKEFITMVDLN